MSFQLTEGVTFAYANGRVVLRDLGFALESGSALAILGRSGVGKTTLLNVLALLWDRALLHGEIVYTSPRLGPVSYSRLSHADQARLRREEFGLVPQNAHFLSRFTCRQNLGIPLALLHLGRSKTRDRIEQLLEAARVAGIGADLQGALDLYPSQVSTGQRQRLSVLRAVAHDPVVLFADEPVSNLDAENKAQMLALFRLWRNNDLRLPGAPQRSRTLVLICHETETAWDLADHYLFLSPPGAPCPAGASGQPISHQDFCARHGLDPGPREKDRLRGADALRHTLAGALPLNGHVRAASPVAPGGESR